MTIDKKIILASRSPRRKEILSQLKIPFEVKVSHVKETFDSGMPPDKVVEYLSLIKAREVAKNAKEESLVIGSDTIIFFANEFLGKPQNKENAKKILNKLRGKQHSVFTGLAIINNKTKEEKTAFVEAKIIMRDYSAEEIDDYISTGEPMDKAGAYAIQGLGRKLIREYKGCYTGIVGLPLCKLKELLQQFGVISS